MNSIRFRMLTLGGLAFVSTVLWNGLVLAQQDPPQGATQATQASFEETLLVCTSCHGENGTGSLAAPRLAGQNKRYLYEQMLHFKTGLRAQHPDDVMGQSMIEWVVDLDDKRLDALATHFASQDGPKRRADPQAGADTSEARGMKIFSNNCKACHASRYGGADSIYVPNVAILDADYLKRSLNGYRAGWRGGPDASTRAKNMRQMAYQLDDEQAIDDLVAYLALPEQN